VRKSADEAQRSAGACNDLSTLACDLKQIIGSFKLGERTTVAARWNRPPAEAQYIHKSLV
jgi:hypothetical protein